MILSTEILIQNTVEMQDSELDLKLTTLMLYLNNYLNEAKTLGS